MVQNIPHTKKSNVRGDEPEGANDAEIMVPGSAGSALEGAGVDGLTLMIVPPKGGGLKPDDPAIPAEIAANLKKVLADASKHDATKSAYTLKEGFNLLADLDIKSASIFDSLANSEPNFFLYS